MDHGEILSWRGPWELNSNISAHILSHSHASYFRSIKDKN